MTRILVLLVLLLPAFGAEAGDLLRGRAINKTCALCHGAFGQGTEGTVSPRIAGLNTQFLDKVLKQYRDGTRKNDAMVVTAGIDKMSDDDIESISQFLASIDLRDDRRFDIAVGKGDPDKGEDIYKGDCKSCHARNGYGKPDKNVPPVAGQQTDYLIDTISRYKSRERVHDDTPGDPLFDGFSEDDIKNLTAYLANLDNTGEPRTAELPGLTIAELTDKSGAPGMRINDIVQTVAKIELRDGVGREDAIDAMRNKAVELNMRLVGEQHVSKALEERGDKTPYLAIFQFCNLEDAKTIVVNNPVYAAYMPCRVALIEDKDGKHWLMMLNLDILIDNQLISKEVVRTVIGVNQKMLEIMVAGATGQI